MSFIAQRLREIADDITGVYAVAFPCSEEERKMMIADATFLHDLAKVIEMKD